MLAPFLVALAYSLSADSLPAQTRVEVIEQERAAHSRQVAPEAPPKAEQAVLAIEKNPVFKALFGNPAGLRLRIGGMVPGSGFALGPEYTRPDLLNGNLKFRVSARASSRKYQRYEAELVAPYLASDKLYASLYAVHLDYPSMSYFGPGPKSSEEGRTVYRLENTAYGATLAYKPIPRLKVGVTGGYLEVNTGPSSHDEDPSAERIFSPAVTPGIDVQSNFLSGGPMLQYDYRDHAGRPRSGGNYEASYIFFDDRKLGRNEIQRFTAEANQYIPFFNEKRVIALRGRTVLSYRNTGQVVPFYLQPTLGGSEDLRGFQPFRFYDNNLLVFNGEYRWEVMSGFDMALFADAGKVFHNHSELDLTGLERSFGYGLRVGSRDTVAMRIDTGFSREGFQVWFKFGNFF